MEQGAKRMADPNSQGKKVQTRDGPVEHGPDDIVHAMSAITAAPMSPAAPSCAACVAAALLVVAGFVVVGLPEEDWEEV